MQVKFVEPRLQQGDCATDSVDRKGDPKTEEVTTPVTTEKNILPWGTATDLQVCLESLDTNTSHPGHIAAACTWILFNTAAALCLF